MVETGPTGRFIRGLGRAKLLTRWVARACSAQRRSVNSSGVEPGGLSAMGMYAMTARADEKAL